MEYEIPESGYLGALEDLDSFLGMNTSKTAITGDYDKLMNTHRRWKLNPTPDLARRLKADAEAYAGRKLFP